MHPILIEKYYKYRMAQKFRTNTIKYIVILDSVGMEL